MSIIHVHLKSGHTLKVECDDFHITYDKSSGDVTSYKIEGLLEKSERPIYINPGQIAAVTVKS